MLIAQITDLHIGVDGDEGARENYRRLRNTLDALVNMQPQPDLVIATGDLVESASEDAYRLVKRMFEGAPFDVWPCLGSHDRRYPFRKTFSSSLFDGEFVQYAVDAGDVRIVIVDTLSEGARGGSFSSRQAEWLDDLLAQAPDRPTIIAQHHPPVFTGISWMTAHGDDPWVARYRDVISRHSHVKKIITGHARRPMERPFAGTSLIVAGAIAAPVSLNLSPLDPEKCDGRTLVVNEPPSFALHFWDGEEVVTHRGVVGDFDAVVDYDASVQRQMADIFPAKRVFDQDTD
jgi:3',5'-cyclic AMP phosphodiesterase CpdA